MPAYKQNDKLAKKAIARRYICGCTVYEWLPAWSLDAPTVAYMIGVCSDHATISKVQEIVHELHETMHLLAGDIPRCTNTARTMRTWDCGCEVTKPKGVSLPLPCRQHAESREIQDCVLALSVTLRKLNIQLTTRRWAREQKRLRKIKESVARYITSAARSG